MCNTRDSEGDAEKTGGKTVKENKQTRKASSMWLLGEESCEYRTEVIVDREAGIR